MPEFRTARDLAGSGCGLGYNANFRRVRSPMKIPYLYLALSLVFFLAGFTLGQDTQGAVLVDEHGSLPCDDTLGRLDLFFSELSKDSGSTGLVVLSAPLEKKRVSVFRQFLIKAHARDRGFTSNEIRYVRTTFGKEFQVQLWRLPAGVAEPAIENIDMSFSLPETIGSHMLGGEYSYGDGICPEVEDGPIFAAFLRDNPRSRGNIVVRQRTLGQARRRAARIIRQLQKNHGIPRSRLRIFPQISSNPTNNLEPIVEYWYLP